MCNILNVRFPLNYLDIYKLIGRVTGRNKKAGDKVRTQQRCIHSLLRQGTYFSKPSPRVYVFLCVNMSCVLLRVKVCTFKSVVSYGG